MLVPRCVWKPVSLSVLSENVFGWGEKGRQVLLHLLLKKLKTHLVIFFLLYHIWNHYLLKLSGYSKGQFRCSGSKLDFPPQYYFYFSFACFIAFFVCYFSYDKCSIHKVCCFINDVKCRAKPSSQKYWIMKRDFTQRTEEGTGKSNALWQISNMKWQKSYQ